MAVARPRVACFVFTLLLLSACGRENSGSGGGEGNSPTGPSGTSIVAIRISILCFSPECAGGSPKSRSPSAIKYGTGVRPGSGAECVRYRRLVE